MTELNDGTKTIVDEEEVEMHHGLSLFGERKSVVYRIPGIDQVVRVNALEGNVVESDCALIKQRQMLFAEHIWPGSLVIADYLAANPHLCCGRSVLELGAGGGLPSIVASKLDANIVVCSDFPDDDLLNNLRTLATLNDCPNNFVVASHRWGDDASNLLQYVCNDQHNNVNGFDLIIVAECLWKDTYLQHDSLWNSIEKCCHVSGSSTRTTTVLISFAHRPCDGHTPIHDLEFIEKGRKTYSFDCMLIDSIDKYSDAMESDVVTEYLFIATKHKIS
jgi:predicted nicotinamide N-methyase